MGLWQILTPEKACLSYKIPKELASNPQNVFYGGKYQPNSNSFEMDGVWPLIAFLFHPLEKDIVILHICTVDGDLLELLDIKNRTPFDYPNGQYLNLTKEELSEFINLLQYHSELLKEKENTNGKIFNLIPNANLATLGINDEKFRTGLDYSFTKQEYYHQRVAPVTYGKNNEIFTLLSFTAEASPNRKGLLFRICEINKDFTKRPNFSYFDMLNTALGRIVLDKQGIKELQNLLKQQLEYLG